LRLIARAQDALAGNRPDDALVALNEHASKFPQGELADERNALRVLAACSKGTPGASATAEQFVRTHPRSPITPRIRQECLKK
jgi:hypothetical protein